MGVEIKFQITNFYKRLGYEYNIEIIAGKGSKKHQHKQWQQSLNKTLVHNLIN